MRLFCRADHPSCPHTEWEVTGARFTPPPTRAFQMTGFINDHFIDLVTFGLTNVTQRCKTCKVIKVTEHRGRVEVPGYEWKTTTTAVRR